MREVGPLCGRPSWPRSLTWSWLNGANPPDFPEMVGRRLKSLGFRTESIGSRGNGLWLLCEIRTTIHKLAREDP